MSLRRFVEGAMIAAGISAANTPEVQAQERTDTEEPTTTYRLDAESGLFVPNPSTETQPRRYMSVDEVRPANADTISTQPLLSQEEIERSVGMTTQEASAVTTALWEYITTPVEPEIQHANEGTVLYRKTSRVSSTDYTDASPEMSFGALTPEIVLNKPLSIQIDTAFLQVFRRTANELHVARTGQRSDLSIVGLDINPERIVSDETQTAQEIRGSGDSESGALLNAIQMLVRNEGLYPFGTDATYRGEISNIVDEQNISSGTYMAHNQTSHDLLIHIDDVHIERTDDGLYHATLHFTPITIENQYTLLK